MKNPGTGETLKVKTLRRRTVCLICLESIVFLSLCNNDSSRISKSEMEIILVFS